MAGFASPVAGLDMEVYFSALRKNLSDVLFQVAAYGMRFSNRQGGRNTEAEMNSVNYSGRCHFQFMNVRVAALMLTHQVPDSLNILSCFNALRFVLFSFSGLGPS